MKTKTHGCCEEVETTARTRTCLPCDIPPFCRNNYYRGKLLTERDFTEEQRYSMDKHRYHTLMLHGWGVVCGLDVRPHKHCPKERIVITAGLAIDACGHEIRVYSNIEELLPKPDRKKPKPPCPEDDHKPHHEAEQYLHEGEAKEERDEKYEEDHPDPTRPCDDEVPPRDLYICIAYSECETEFAATPFDDCGCNGDAKKPNRICESYTVLVTYDKPKHWDDTGNEPCGCADCREIFEEAALHCHKPHALPCMPLAIIHDFVAGEKVTDDMIDNVSARRQLVSVQTLDRVVRCILEKLPTANPSRIRDTSWQHGERVLCHRFMQQYVGGKDQHGGFTIYFDSPVSADPIDTRSFMAMIVFRPAEMSEPRHLVFAPVTISKAPGPVTDWCTLHIDPAYAKRHLDGRNFDLFVTLKCNVIIGRHGLAVDGNFLAGREDDDVARMVFPTGDNIKGGTFESWIRVRPHPKGSQQY
jgi:hypothetical protein